MGDIDPQVFGGLIENVKTLLIQQRENRVEQDAANATLAAKLDRLSTHGCAVGAQHEKDVLDIQLKIKELGERPAKLVAMGLVIISVLAAIGGFALWIHGLLSGRGE